MSRLQTYLNEENEEFWSDWWPLIVKNCMPYLKDLKSADKFFWREMNGPDFQLKKVRKNRKPLDTPLKIHEYWDKMFQKKFGWKPRSQGLFVWADKKFIYRYYMRLVFPLGDYKALWSPWVCDLYANTDADTAYEYLISLDDLDNWSNEQSAKEAKLMKTYNYMSNGRFDISLDSVSRAFNGLSADPMQDTMKFWKDYYMEDIVLKTYKETSIKEVKPVSPRSEVMLKCDKYYSIMLKNESDYYKMNTMIREL